MNEIVCRLCLSNENLTQLFKNSEEFDEQSSNLLTITCLKIGNNDGFPQHICDMCTNIVDAALELRKRSQLTEEELLIRGYRKRHENITYDEELIEPVTEIESIDFIEDCANNESFTETRSDVSDAETKWPIKRTVKKPSKKEQRQIYLNMVEGDLDPNGPVTCKICKFCGESFISTTKLNRHCRSYHGMKKELKCNYCSYLALDNTQLKLHIRRMHTGERPYVCDICGSSYHSRRCLVQHLESHRTVAHVQEGENLVPTDAEGKFIVSNVDYVDTWKAMETLVEKGLTRSIGVSNFNKKQMDRLLEASKIKPVMLQVEVHPYLNQQPLIDYCRTHDITVTAYSPLGSGDRPWVKPGDPSLLDEPKIKPIAEKYGKSLAQVLIRYAIDRGLIVIPKSVTKSRIIENFNVFDFQLTLEDIKEIGSLERKGRMCMMGDTHHPDYPFHDEY